MSEYQFIDFVAIAGPVGDDDLEFMRARSTRADVTKWRFTNEYHFGDFHGNTKEMLRRGYDAHKHFANYGLRMLMFRLPYGLPCDKRMFGKYAIRNSFVWEPDNRGKGGVLTTKVAALADYRFDCHVR